MTETVVSVKGGCSSVSGPQGGIVLTTTMQENVNADLIVQSSLVGALFDAWDDLDLVLAGLTSAEMIEPWGGGSALAWTYGHVANSTDSWTNVGFQRRTPHPVIGDHNLRFGGDGRATDWSAIQQGVTEVRESARDYLYKLTDSDLDLVIPYDGSLVALHSQGLSLRHAVTVDLVHHHYHVGEIATKRAQLGHIVPHLSGRSNVWVSSLPVRRIESGGRRKTFPAASCC